MYDLILGKDMGNNAKIAARDDHDIKSRSLFKRIIGLKTKPITSFELLSGLSNSPDDKWVLLRSILT
jgi:hypothetical protein